jgi:osmotically-inducible protein OsmY
MKKLIQIALMGVALSQFQGCATTTEGGESSDGLDRRTAGTFVSDQEIEFRVMSRMSEAFPDKTGSISTVSYNRQVLLTGQVPNEEMRNRATEIAKQVPEVRTVFNELTVSGIVSVTAEINDMSITTSVKARMLGDDKVPASKIKVVTTAGIVYLMGLVTHAEAAAATQVARTTSGVTKVVTLFEYID